MIWALMIMKICGKERIRCFLVGGSDPKQFRKWVWLFIKAIVNLEEYVVSSFALSIFNCFSILLIHPIHFQDRFFLLGSKNMLITIDCCW